MELVAGFLLFLLCMIIMGEIGEHQKRKEQKKLMEYIGDRLVYWENQVDMRIPDAEQEFNRWLDAFEQEKMPRPRPPMGMGIGIGRPQRPPISQNYE